jgi:hypothetical protein
MFWPSFPLSLAPEDAFYGFHFNHLPAGVAARGT